MIGTVPRRRIQCARRLAKRSYCVDLFEPSFFIILQVPGLGKKGISYVDRPLFIRRLYGWEKRISLGFSNVGFLWRVPRFA